jgi:hypothetical protein
MTYFIIRDNLIIIYLFYYLHKKLNKTNCQIRSLKVKNDIFNEMEGVASKEGKSLLATKMTTEKKDKAKKGPSLAPPVLASR